jgi:hypothetical protein
MFGKTHTSFALSKISKPGNFNPMFGNKKNKNKKQKTKTKTKKLYRI